MSFPDETLMAYVDRELDADSAAAIEAAAARDPRLAERIEKQRALRKAIHAAYEPVLEEPTPQRLLGLASGAQPAPPRSQRRWSWLEWSAVAASLALGIAIGALLRVSTTGDDLLSQQGRLIAGGSLALALSRQLASDQPTDAPNRVGLTFLSRDGNYCRTFTREKEAQAGLACNDGGTWRLEVIARSTADTNDYRMAATQLPPAVLRAVQERMQGTTLDAAAELAARERGWRR